MLRLDHFYIYTQLIKNKLAHIDPINNIAESIKNFQLQYKQALYIVDYKKAEVVLQRNIFEILGYREDEFTMPLILGGFLHPKQKTTVSIILQSIISLATDGKCNKINARFILLYKVLHKNGTYKTILRQTTALQTDKDGRMLSSYSLITDVTSILTTDKVKWKLEGCEKGFKEEVEAQIKANTKNVFSGTEIRLLQELKLGRTSKEVAASWNKSYLTINTHRRNMLTKANCKNTPELLLFATKNEL